MERNDAAAQPRANQWWVTVMLVLAGIVIPIAICLSWFAFLILDADRFTRTVTPIIDMPEVQAAITTALTDEVDESVDSATDAHLAVRDLVDIAGGEDKVVADVSAVIASSVSSSQFRAVWEEVNYVAHVGLVDILTNDVDKLEDDLTLAFTTIETWSGIDPSSPTGEALAAIPPELAPEIEVLNPVDIPAARFAIDYADLMAFGAIILATLLFIGAMIFGVNHRRALIVAGCAALVSLPMAVFIRSILNDTLADFPGVQGVLAREYARALTASLEASLLLAAAIGLIVAVLAWFWPRLSRNEPQVAPA